MLKFDLPKDQSSIIKVIGVGGGGGNAVSHMFNQGIEGVDFIVCNTDAQAMKMSPVPTKIQLGERGLGAGSVPAVGKESAIENIEDIKQLLDKNTKMLFITAGMGGGTGTGAAPVIAEVAKEMGILTVGIVTLPFAFEGRKRKLQAEAGIDELKQSVDTLLVIGNDKLRDVHGNLKLSEAFQQADNILTVAAKGIAEIITVTGYINVDFEDVKTVMKDSGTAIMGSATAEGENRAMEAVETALSSPLLNDNHIVGADNILLYVSSGAEEITMDEVVEITDYIQEEAGQNAEIIWGNGIDESLGNKISITLVATGFKTDSVDGKPKRKIVHPLTFERKEKPIAKTSTRITEPISEITLIPSKKEVEDKKEETKTEVVAERKPVETEESPSGIYLKKKEESPALEIDKPIMIKEPVSDEVEQREISFSLPRDEEPEIELSPEKQAIEKKSVERIRKLKDLSVKLKSQKELEAMENVPAYIRRNIELNDVKPSAETVIPKYTIGEGENNKGEILTNNSFLHDNVD
ncbi:MAG: cell division protein FtsZ [Chlorobi bacterium]|nr:cell division protein FtsZ [Chlorobiota bacterium]